jgi:hypothetical protein
METGVAMLYRQIGEQEEILKGWEYVYNLNREAFTSYCIAGFLWTNVG